MRPLLDASIAQARATGDGGRLAVGLAIRGWLALRRGDLSAAEADARTALAATELPAPPMYRALNGGVLVEGARRAGRARRGRAGARCVRRPRRTSGVVTAAVLRLARGRLRVAQGRVAEGLEDFLGVGAGLTRALVTSPGYLPWRSEAALAQLALGEREPAQRLAEEELELARAFGAPRALGVALRAAGLVAGGDAGELLLREAVDAFDARRREARARARARRPRRDASAAQPPHAKRASCCARRSTPPTARAPRQLAEQAETELRATGARPRRVVLHGLDSLTASERRIAELAGQGLTNREIAQTLFVTARTVEGHLTSVFRKLRLNSRNDLAAVLAESA